MYVRFAPNIRKYSIYIPFLVYHFKILFNSTWESERFGYILFLTFASWFPISNTYIWVPVKTRNLHPKRKKKTINLRRFESEPLSSFWVWPVLSKGKIQIYSTVRIWVHTLHIKHHIKKSLITSEDLKRFPPTFKLLYSLP